ncbi:unnamed protein product, partial [Linum tenue]
AVSNFSLFVCCRGAGDWNQFVFGVSGAYAWWMQHCCAILDAIEGLSSHNLATRLSSMVILLESNRIIYFLPYIPALFVISMGLCASLPRMGGDTM